VSSHSAWRSLAVRSGARWPGGQAGDGALAVASLQFPGVGVAAGGVQAPQAHQLGDEDQVVAGADERGAEGVPKDGAG